MDYGKFYHRLWAPLMEKAELGVVRERRRPQPLFRPHDLRHVAISLWVDQGASQKKVQSWAGHASIAFTLDRYGHLWVDRAGDRAIANGAQRSVFHSGD